MLEHPPPLPLVVDFFERGRNITPEDEGGIFLALKPRDRVLLRVRFNTPFTNPQKFIATMDEEYPILGYLIIVLPHEDVNTILIFPETLQAPDLRHIRLRLRGFALRIGSRLLTAAMGLVSLHLVMVHPSTYFHPNTMLPWISLMPHLEGLTIFFQFPIPKHDVERQLTHTPSRLDYSTSHSWHKLQQQYAKAAWSAGGALPQPCIARGEQGRRIEVRPLGERKQLVNI